MGGIGFGPRNNPFGRRTPWDRPTLYDIPPVFARGVAEAAPQADLVQSLAAALQTALINRCTVGIHLRELRRDLFGDDAVSRSASSADCRDTRTSLRRSVDARASERIGRKIELRSPP